MNKRFTILVMSCILTIGLFLSCDKVENPYPPKYDIDTSLYPGNWEDYLAIEYPIFPENNNTNRNVLIEDYTGHHCNNCPNAATIAHDIEVANPTRVFVASIHAAPSATGTSSFQDFDPLASSYYTDHTNPQGRDYGIEFKNGFNFFGNPQGTVNRATVDNKMFDLSGTWESRTNSILSDADLKVNIQSVFNFYESSNGGYLHVEVKKETSDPLSMNLVVYVIEDTLVDWQLMPDNTDNEFYEHQSKHLGCIDELSLGRAVFSQESAIGDKKIIDYSYVLPEGLVKENMHFLIYVFDTESYEILQVVKQEIE